MNVRMDRAFTYDVKDQPGVTRTLPAGWVGDVEDEIGKAAVKDGSAIDTAPKPEKPKKVTDKEIIEGLSENEKADYEKMDAEAKAKFIDGKRSAQAA